MIRDVEIKTREKGVPASTIEMILNRRYGVFISISDQDGKR